jgi:membrane associated rhomboid family serine protease
VGYFVGVGGLVLVVAAGVVRWRSRDKRLIAAACFVALAGWSLAAQFLLKPLVPRSVVIAALLGGITAGVLAAAVIGSRRTRQPRTARRLQGR